MDAQKRLDDIMSIVSKKKRVSNADLSKAVFCSPSTLRRDLIELEKKELLKRIHGGVILNKFDTSEPALFLRETEHLEQKKAIANIASSIIGPGMCIFLDASSTVFELCPLITSIEHLIIFTSGLKAASFLSDSCSKTTKIFVNGGEIKHRASSIIKVDSGSQFIDHFNIDVAFFSARGIDQNGIYEANLAQAVSKKYVMEHSRQSCLLIDNSKFNQSQFFKIGDFKNYNILISNTKPDDNLLTSAEKNDIEWLFD